MSRTKVPLSIWYSDDAQATKYYIFNVPGWTHGSITYRTSPSNQKLKVVFCCNTAVQLFECQKGSLANKKIYCKGKFIVLASFNRGIPSASFTITILKWLMWTIYAIRHRRNRAQRLAGENSKWSLQKILHCIFKFLAFIFAIKIRNRKQVDRFSL